jgi:hypothetical protein
MNRILYPLLFIIVFVFSSVLCEPIDFNILFSYTINDIVFGDFNAGDSKTISKVALDYYYNSKFSEESLIVLGVWPPGMIYFQIFVLNLFGLNVPMLFIQKIVGLLSYLIFIIIYTKIIKNPFLKKITPFLFILIPYFSYNFFSSISISLVDPIAISFFISGLVLLLNKKYFYLSSIFFVLSAYLRPQFEIIFTFSFSILLSSFLLIFIVKKMKKNEKSFLLLLFKKALIIFLIFQALGLPQRYFIMSHYDYPVWTGSPKSQANQGLRTTEDLESNQFTFFVRGGGNVACVISPEDCYKKDSSISTFLKVFLSNPFSWIEYKFEKIGDYWFSSYKSLTVPNDEHSKISFAINFIFMIMPFLNLFFLSYIFFKFSKKTSDLVISQNTVIFLLLFIPLFLIHLMIFIFYHFEVRYFLLPKIISFIYFVVIVDKLTMFV